MLLKSPAVSPSSSPMKSTSLPPAPERDGERSFLVESPRGELMQVELLRTVGCSGGRLVSPCSATGFGGRWKAIAGVLSVAT